MDDKQKKKDIIAQIKEMKPDLSKEDEAKIKKMIDMDDDSTDLPGDEIVLDKIAENLYKDKAGGLWNSAGDLIGSISTDGTLIYFDKLTNIDDADELNEAEIEKILNGS